MTPQAIATTSPANDRGAPHDAGRTLNIAMLRAQAPENPGRVLRQALTQNASEEGLSYKSCQRLKEILNDGFLLVGTRGVWDNTTTARNMIFVALDSIPGFREPRVQYTRLLRHAVMRPLSEDEVTRLDRTRARMSALLYEHVLGNGEGAATTFITTHKLATLTSAPREFLDRTDSFGALLRFALPGLIDETRPGCIQPHHIEHFHLNDPAYCERLFLRALSTQIGKPLHDYLRARERQPDSAARQVSIHRLASAIREEILVKAGGDDWLLASGIFSLVSRPSLHLRTASFGGLIDRFLPDLVNHRDPRALQPHEIHHGMWGKKEYARLQVLRAFHSYSPKLPEVKKYCELATAGSKISREIRNDAFQAALGIPMRKFIAHGRLQSLHIRPPDFLSAEKTASLEDFARFCFRPSRANR